MKLFLIILSLFWMSFSMATPNKISVEIDGVRYQCGQGGESNCAELAKLAHNQYGICKRSYPSGDCYRSVWLEFKKKRSNCIEVAYETCYNDCKESFPESDCYRSCK